MSEDTTITKPEVVPEPIETKDMGTILLLRALKHVPDKIEATAQPNTMVLVYHFGNTAWTDYDRYMRGEDIMVNVRDYEAAGRELKNNIHRFSHQR